MKIQSCLGYASLLCLLAKPVQAQDAAQLEKVGQQVRQIQEQFERQQRELREGFEKLIHEQQAQIDALKKQLEQLQHSPAPLVNTAQTNATPRSETEELKRRVDDLTAASKKTFASQLNPGIGFVGDTVFSYTSRGKDLTGADRPGGADAFLRTVELSLQATVDPFARAYGVILGAADAKTGEATLHVEEAALITTSLPWNLTAEAGRFFADFGRLSSVHAHDLPFVFRPLVLDTYIGGESRTDGAQLNYLFPTTHFISLTAGAGNSFGGDSGPNDVGGYRSLNELNYWTHLSTYFDLNSNLNLETGVSGLMNDRAESRGGIAERRRRVVAADITLRYQPLGTGLRRGWVWGTEVLLNSAAFDRDPDGTPASGDEFRGRERSIGLYSYLETKLSRSLQAGFLFDWNQAPANHQERTSRYSPYITYHPSEFQLLRLQYSHTSPNSATGLRDSEGIYFQWQFILGKHSHGFKQR